MTEAGLLWAKAQLEENYFSDRPVTLVLLVAGVSPDKLPALHRELQSFTAQCRRQPCTFHFQGLDNVFVSFDCWEAAVAQYALCEHLRPRFPSAVPLVFNTADLPFLPGST